jgi:type I restriction enzyme, R subunit
MTPTDTSEKGLETLIEESLIDKAGYVKGESADYDRTYCVDTTQLFRFLKNTQPVKVDKQKIADGGLKQEKFLKRLSDEIKKRHY